MSNLTLRKVRRNVVLQHMAYPTVAKSVHTTTLDFETITNRIKNISEHVVMKVVHDSKFPKRKQAQINFLADSLAAWGRVSPRRARDICGRERAKEHAMSPHKIIRKEFYIECSCGYKGPAYDNACRECGAGIPSAIETRWGNPLLFR